MANFYSCTVVFVLFFMTISQAKVVKYKDCGSGSKVDEVDVSPCSVLPCVLVKGENASIDLKFIPDHVAKGVTVNLQGIIGGIPLPFPIPHPDACAWAGSGLKCPLKKGQQQLYTMKLPVRSSYPSLKLLAKLSLLDEKKNPLVCVEIPLQIK